MDLLARPDTEGVIGVTAIDRALSVMYREGAGGAPRAARRLGRRASAARTCGRSSPRTARSTSARARASPGIAACSRRACGRCPPTRSRPSTSTRREDWALAEAVVAAGPGQAVTAVRVLVSARDPGGRRDGAGRRARAAGRRRPRRDRGGERRRRTTRWPPRASARSASPCPTAPPTWPAGADPDGAARRRRGAARPGVDPDVLVVTHLLARRGPRRGAAGPGRAGGATFALQDYPGDANAIGGAHAGTYFVRDEAAARLTRERWGVAAIAVGSLRHAPYARLDVPRLRAETRARIGAAAGQAVLGFFAQPRRHARARGRVRRPGGGARPAAREAPGPPARASEAPAGRPRPTPPRSARPGPRSTMRPPTGPRSAGSPRATWSPPASPTAAWTTRSSTPGVRSRSARCSSC